MKRSLENVDFQLLGEDLGHIRRVQDSGKSERNEQWPVMIPGQLKSFWAKDRKRDHPSVSQTAGPCKEIVGWKSCGLLMNRAGGGGGVVTEKNSLLVLVMHDF